MPAGAPLIIVEGPDGGGKSTLIDSLAKDFNLDVSPRVVSKDTEAMVDLKRWTVDNVARGWQNLLFDRHRLISEPIYGSVMRNYFEPGFDNWSWLFMMYHRFYEAKPLIIYCLPPFEIVRDNIWFDDDNSTVKNSIRSIYSQYTAQCARDMADHQALVWDYTNPGTMMNLIYQAVGMAISRGKHEY